MDGDTLRFRLYKILHGPIQKAFAYVFHHTYQNNLNVYEFALQHRDNFTEVELLSLQHEKRMSNHSLPLLYSVIKSSCNPPLASPDDAVWRVHNNNVKQTENGCGSVESLLGNFLKVYEEATSTSNFLSKKEFDEMLITMKLWLQQLIEEAGKFDSTGRWKEELDKMMHLMQDIEQKKVFPTEEIAGDIKTELRMCYHHYHRKGINSLLLQLSFDQEIPEHVKRKYGKKPELALAVSDLVKTIVLDDSSDKGRVCVIRGEPGCGRTNLVSLLAASWNQKDNQVIDINKYEVVMVVSGLLVSVEQKGMINSILPLCTSIHGIEEVRKYLVKSHVLLVVDDFEEFSRQDMEEVNTLISESDGIDAIMLTSPKCFDTIKENWSGNFSMKLKLDGLGREEIITSAEKIMCEMEGNDFKSLKQFLMTNMCRLEVVLKYPITLVETCEAWIDAPDVMEHVSTCTELLWALTEWKIGKALKSAIEIADNTKIKDWLLAAGLKALQALIDDRRLEKGDMADLETESSKVFTSMLPRNLTSRVFKKRYMQRSLFYDEPCDLHRIQQEFLAAWYVAHQVIDGKSLNVLFEHSKCPYHLAVFMAGLLSKIKEFKWISGMHERRLMKAIVNYSEDSNEDLNFNFDLVAEVKGLVKSVELIVDFSEYPDEWNVDAADVQIIPLEALLIQVAPTRIFINVEELKPYSELQKVISFLCKVDIYVWLDSSCQFKYGDSHKMDHIAKSFFSKKSKTRIDLMKGNVSTKVLKELPSQAPYSHLVFLKLRILDLKGLLAVLKVPKNLPKLLWLEIKFDFPILEEDVSGIPSTTVPLIDVHLQGLDDSCVSKLANLLGSMHNCYAGIHLQNTTLTPEGLFVLLKQLQKRNVYLHSPPEHREKFRRWYYPQLSNFDKSIELTDELAIKLLGFDDRIYYSNHFVSSSCFALALDSWNLSSYLEEEKDIVQFTYKTDNLTCIKELSGAVNIMVNGECQKRKK